MHPKLVWVEGLKNSLSMLLDTTISCTIKETVDPLKKLVIIDLGEPLGKKDYNPLQTIVHAFAKSNDCVIAKINKESMRIVLEVLTKTRLGKTMNKNPLATRDKNGS